MKVFVAETMMEDRKLEGIRRKCGFSEGLCISSEGHSGGLGLWWRDINVHLISYSSHHIFVEVRDNCETGLRWFAYGIYGWADRIQKRRTWELIEKIRAETSGPLIMFGDFNEILSHQEREGGNRRSDREMDAFRRCINSCGLSDLGYRGNIFTWSRGLSSDSMIRERLDRFLASVEWFDLCPYFDV